MGYGYFGYGYGFDWTILLIIAASLLSVFASFGVQATFSRYAKVRCARGTTGAAAARKILDANGLHNIRVEHVSGNLSDHFDPSANVVRLSDSTYNSDSVAAVGVAAHECGHAIQHAEGYVPIKIRNAIVPAVNIGNQAALPLLLIGLLFNILGIAWLGVIMYSAVLVFQLVTLPVEINASRRALRIVESSGMLFDEENKGAKKVLTAAAMTYVAAVAATALQILRFVFIILGRSNRRD